MAFNIHDQDNFAYIHKTNARENSDSLRKVLWRHSNKNFPNIYQLSKQKLLSLLMLNL